MISKVFYVLKHKLLSIEKLVKGAIFLATLWILPASANTLNFEQIYIFGDSLSDSGNFYKVTNFTFPPSPFYFPGRFTNGLNWVDYLTQELELNPELQAKLDLNNPKIPVHGVNFAYGGASTGISSIPDPSGTTFLGLEKQIESFTNLLNDRSANSEALYTLWAGANDYLGFFAGFPFPEPNPTEIVDNLSSALTTLAEVGALNFLVPNLPDLGTIPLSRSLGNDAVATLNDLTEEHNTLLEESLEELNQTFDANFMLFDVNALFKDFIVSVDLNHNEFGKFGFTNVTDNCSGTNFPTISTSEDNLNLCLSNNPDTFLWWDNQHPTSAAHKFIAESALDVLSYKTTDIPEPTSIWGLLAVMGLPSIGSLLLGKKQKKD